MTPGRTDLLGMIEFGMIEGMNNQKRLDLGGAQDARMVRRTFTLPPEQVAALVDCSDALGVSASLLLSHLLSGSEDRLHEVAETYHAPDASPLSNRGHSVKIARGRIAKALREVGL